MSATVVLLFRTSSRVHTIRGVRFMNMKCRPRVLLAEDHPETAELLRVLLQVDCDVVAVVGDGRSLVSVADRLAPDVIVSDISMPGVDGIAAASAILLKRPATRIVFVTVQGDPRMVARGLAAGALGYVLKVVAGDDLMPAVRAALRGERHVSRELQVPEGTSGTPPQSPTGY